MRFQSYFNIALSLIRQYNGATPLTHFLKQYFSQHKKHGSKDRKWIAHLCYCYYRIGHVVKDLSPEERMRIAIYLCHSSYADWAILFEPSWIDQWSESLDERIDFICSLYPSFSTADIFPWGDALSSGIDADVFSKSHLIQPDLFLRIRPGKEKIVTQKLSEADIAFERLAGSCVALPNASKIDTVLSIDRDVVIQDRSSQNVADYFSAVKEQVSVPISVWDCCAASGGKSILAKDILQEIDLTVSDVRASILHNLQQRFDRAGIDNYHAFIADMASDAVQMGSARLLIVDAPCTGSGTWGRTPEQLFFFTKEKIATYAALQQKIVRNAIRHVEKQGYLLYITCSVFREENEAMLDMIQQEVGWTIVKSGTLIGYEIKADTMFAALLKKG